MLDLSGKRYIVFGVANERSIAWAIAWLLIQCKAEVVFSSHPKMIEGVRALTRKYGLPNAHIYSCDVSSDADMDRCFEDLSQHAPYDGCVHSIAFSPEAGVRGEFLEAIDRETFRIAMDISVFSFYDITRRSVPLMPHGGSVLTLTFDAAEGVYPYYNAMGVAKAALNTTVLYAANQLGKHGIRVNAISASPENTLSARGVEDPYSFRDWTEAMSPMGRRATLEEVAAAAVWLLSPFSSGTTGEISFVDCGTNIVKMPTADRALAVAKAGWRTNNLLRGRSRNENIDALDHIDLGGRVKALASPLTPEDLAQAHKPTLNEQYEDRALDKPSG